MEFWFNRRRLNPTHHIEYAVTLDDELVGIINLSKKINALCRAYMKTLKR